MTDETVKVNNYEGIAFMRWEVDDNSQELICVHTRVGANVVATVINTLASGGSVEARTYLTDNYNMPHDGRTVMLIDAHLTRMSPSPLETMPLGETKL